MTAQKNKSSRLVYSTQQGKLCTVCKQPIANCICRKKNSPSTGDGIVRVSRQTKGRKGKGVTIITGVPLTGSELKKLAKQLKVKCGTGGTVKNGTIEIQGDQRDLIIEELKKKGWTVKRAGG